MTPHRAPNRDWEKPKRDDVERMLELTRDLSDDLSRVRMSANDQTGVIMSRLGYGRVSRQELRRGRLRRLSRRSMMCAAAAAVIWAGFQVYETGTRKPVGPTIPSALRQDLESQQQRFGNTFRLIKDLMPAGAPVGEAEMPSRGLAPPPPSTPETVDEDVNRSAISAVRWV